MRQLGLKKPLFSFVLPVRKGTRVIYHPAYQNGSEVAFFSETTLFKPAKICHLRDAPSHQTGFLDVDAQIRLVQIRETPDTDNPCLENRPQLNKDKRNTD